MLFFSIKFKNIFQKIRYNKGISLSSIADKENRRISLTGRNPWGCVIIDYGHLWCTLLLYIV